MQPVTSLETPLSMIAAIGSDRGLGLNNSLLFHEKEDMDFFKKTTQYGVVIMGRNTWESLPKKPLPNRANIVVSTTLQDEGVQVLPSIDSLFKFLNYQFPNVSAFVIGGAKLYASLIPYTQYLYLSEFEESVKADCFFPDFSDFLPDKEIAQYLDAKHPFKINRYIRAY